MINLSMAEPDNMLRPRITVIGVGGGGGNAINNMIRSNLEGCEFIAANTDAQALAQSLAARKIQLGSNLSRGLGAGSKPNIGCAAAEEALADIMSVLDGSDMLFVTAGMGGGTGTGAAPVIARAARDAGILTVGVVTKPFHFEGTHRMRQAEAGIAELQQYVDTLIVIPNQNLFRIANERTTFAEAFRMADEVLNSGVRGITDLMIMPGFMNLDFADVKTVMGEMGKAMMGTGEADGANRAIEAAEAAISNPLLDDISMKGARGVLINITGGLDMTLFEVDQAANRIREEVDPEAQIKVGSTLGENMDGRIRVSVIATGIDAEMDRKQPRGARQSEGVMASPTAAARAALHAVQEEPVTRRPSVSQVSAPPVQAAPVPVAPKVEPVVDTAATPVATKAGSNYFTMPAAISPRVSTPIGGAPVVLRSQPETTVSSQPIKESREEFVLESEESMQVQAVPAVAEVREEMQTPRIVKPAIPPVREIPPVQQAQRQRTATPVPGVASSRMSSADPDLRVTQLTTPAQTTAQPSASQRAQSLFQRITGFGMVRPSASRDMDDDFDLDDEVKPMQTRLDVEPSDRAPLSSGESDLLDIPAFLRRQSNH